jgi:hypothetical protein
VSNRLLAGAERVRCRNVKCRSKLPIPTSNDHKAFCTPYCRNQFYFWKCVVCERPIQRGKRRKQPDHCHRRDCRLSLRRFPETYLFGKTTEDSPTHDYGSRSAHFTGVKSAQNGTDSFRVVAGPAWSDFSLWAATLDPPNPQKPSSRGAIPANWQPSGPRMSWDAESWRTLSTSRPMRHDCAPSRSMLLETMHCETPMRRRKPRARKRVKPRRRARVARDPDKALRQTILAEALRRADPEPNRGVFLRPSASMN